MKIFNEPIFNPNVSQKNREFILHMIDEVENNWPEKTYVFREKIDLYFSQDSSIGWYKTIFGNAHISSNIETYIIRENPAEPDYILRTIWHETFHLARYEKMREIGELQAHKNKNLFSYMVDEGLAVNFEDEISRKMNYKWEKDENLQRKLYQKIISRNFTELKRIVENNEQDYDHNDWMFGRNFFGYRLGYQIVHEYCADSVKKPSELVGISWHEFWKYFCEKQEKSDNENA